MAGETGVNQRVTGLLTKDQLKRLEDSLPKMIVTSQTTPLEIATSIGVQMVLKKLREDYTYG